MVIFKEQVMIFNHLGAKLATDGCLKHGIRGYTMRAALIVDILWKNKYTNNDSKMGIYQTFARSVISYAAETMSVRYI